MATSFIVQVNNATVYRKYNQALSNLNWTIKKNENWAVVGNNGSGKTTLLKLIFGELLPVEGGSVHWFGTKDWQGILNIREQVGLVSAEFQQSYDQNVTALEVVESGFFSSIGIWEKVKISQKNAAIVKLEELNVRHLQSRPYYSLSYGEARRVLLARALVNRPSLLILDEPCSGLDIPTREYLLETLEKLSKRYRLVYVTHHVEEILPCITHVLCLKEGQALFQGPKPTVLTSKNLSRTLDCEVSIGSNSNRYWITSCRIKSNKLKKKPQ